MNPWLVLLPGLLLAACRGAAPEPSARPLPEPASAPALLGDEPRSPRIANYRIAARLDASTRRLEAEQTLSWTNTGERAVYELPFHLYMNAFKNDESVFMRESRGRHRGARATGRGWGWIDVTSLRLGGEELRPRATFSGPDETILTLPLDQPVAPGESVSLDFAFTVQLPEVFARTGYKGDFIMVAQWFPKIGVLVGPPGAERWHAEPFHLNSEFFADFGTYDVALTVPDTHTIAATGVLRDAVDHPDATRTLTYRAEDVHDFAWMADPHMEYVSGTATTELGQVEVRVYHRPAQRGFAHRHLQAGIGAIEEFSRLFVPYPWPLMSIISPPPDASGAAGMEYPTLVTTAGDHAAARPGIRVPEYVTVHEVGHNWFQGILASNEVDEAWLDEGVNEYADGVVMAALYGKRASFVEWLGFELDMFQMQRATGSDLAAQPSPIVTRSYEFPDFGSYGAVTYGKTALALRTLEHIVGTEAFLAAMKAYAERYAFRHPTGEDFFRTLESQLGRDLDWFVRPAFYERGVVDFRVRSIDCRHPHPPRGVFDDGDGRREVDPGDAPENRAAWICEVLVVNAGTVPAPTDVELRFADGSTAIERWDGTTPWHRLRVERSSRVTEVVIDPQRRVLLDINLLESSLRSQPDPAAARRAGARAQFWVQTLMQVTGL